MAALGRAFAFFRLRNEEDVHELVIDDNFNESLPDGEAGLSVYNPQQSVGQMPTLRTVRQRDAPSTVEMFRHAPLAVGLKVVNSVLALVQLFLVFLVAFGYYDESNCLVKCRTFYDNQTQVFYVPVDMYDDGDPGVAMGRNRQAAHNETGLNTTTTSTGSPIYMLVPFSKMGPEAHTNFTQCQSRCDDYIMPIQGPLVIYIVHFCFTLGLVLKDSYSNVADFIAVCAFYGLESAMLLIAWAVLIHVRFNNEEEADSSYKKYAWHYEEPQGVVDLLIVCIVIGTLTMCFHVAQAINLRRPSKTCVFPNLTSDKWVYRIDLCSNVWFAPVMKLCVCMLSLIAAVATALVAFNDFYVENRDRFHYKAHAEVQAFTMFPVFIWHAMVCFMILPWTGRYQNPCQVQLTLAFYVIELIGLILFVFIFTTFSLFAMSKIRVALTFLIFNLLAWIVDFALHRFPGHECCNRESFDP